jgi:hypothetical protein
MNLQDLKLWQRELALANAGYLQDAPQPSLCIVWEDPADLDAPAKITTPSPQWLRMATLGGVLPPVEAYHDARLSIELTDGRSYQGVTYLEAQDLRLFAKEKGEQVRQERVTDYPVHAAPVISSLTEQEALEYILKKDVPARAWSKAHGASHNRPNFVIAPRQALPGSRFVRNAWGLNPDPASPIEVSMERARELFCRQVANRYLGLEAKLEKERGVAMLTGEPVEEKLQQLRAVDLKDLRRKAYEEVSTPEGLETLVPEILNEPPA